MWLSNLDRRVIATLRDKALRRETPGPRIAVLGNCHSLDIAYAMKLLNVNAIVHRYPIQTKAKINGNMLVRALRTYDHVFLQHFGGDLVRGASSDFLSQQLSNASVYPTLLFGGYHPDSIFVYDRAKGGAFVWGPIGQHHSAIALFAYRTGFSAEAALRLYEPEVFETLGYFDLWGAAGVQLLQSAKSHSLDLQADFLRWTRRGCFMYTINHPKPHVFFDIARRLFDAAGIAMEPVNFDHYAIDDLARDVVFPVYPAIAEHFGMEGSYVFKAAQHSPGGLNIGSFYDLPGFLRESYRVYARHDASDLSNERVQGWLENPEICRFLQEFAAAKGGSAVLPKSQHARSPELAPSVGVG
ncbi:MAG: hypothetical protein QOF41_3472 [Methylobacteriaceae bacterium]|nr:hypothetical protein [Methylobacteriaceae bacterium]